MVEWVSSPRIDLRTVDISPRPTFPTPEVEFEQAIILGRRDPVARRNGKRKVAAPLGGARDDARDAWNASQTLANVHLRRAAEGHVQPSVAPGRGQRRPSVSGKYDVDQGGSAIAPT
jgi:hypothetical protein